ncbi:MAG: S-layer protein [Acidobacteria bacterium]|nr:S-layer protein [Acidobacteriota bacterium]
MKIGLFALLFVVSLGLSITAQTYDNYQKQYTLNSQTDGQIESDRTHRMVLCDYQPSGLYVKRGEQLGITVTGLKAGYQASSMIGFKPMWGDHNKTQEDPLKNGVNTVKANQDGILSFIFVKTEGYDTAPSTINVKVNGGRAFPLFQLGRSNQANWQNDLRTTSDAQFVQLVSDKALITITYKDYLKTPITNIQRTFENLHKVIDWEDEAAGFDNSSPENMKSRNRIHYAVDVFATEKEREGWYMYASNYLIGMKRDNFTDLTEKLNTEWGIWHETGHTHQQNSWTFEAIGEVSVNIFSLYVQEKFGQPLRLSSSESGEGESTLESARRFIAEPNKNFLEQGKEGDADYDEFFVKLVMFHQLRRMYGWDVYKKLHQYFRKTPYPEVEGETDQDKANKFVYAMCFVTKDNLIPFFKKWGLSVDADTANKVNALRLRQPATDPAEIFE